MAATSSYDRLKELKEFDESKSGVKGLSDSGIKTIPDFFKHPPQTLPDVKSKSSEARTKTIPVIDLSKVNTPEHHQGVVNQIKEAAKSWGFFQVINHGIPISVLEKTIEAIKAFHEQPQETKSKYYKREESHGVMYTSNNDLYRAEAACWLDSLKAWMGPKPLDPEELPAICSKEVIEWDLSATKVAETVMGLLSEGLGLEAGKFKELTFSEERVLVGHIYPYCPQPDLTLGIALHTDPGVLTVLLQNQIQGLQVRHEDEWVNVKPVHGGLIINVGDFLQIVSNGEYQSVQHRVVANSCKEPRISVAEFFNLSKWKGDGYYGPLSELLSEQKPAMYRDFTAQEFEENFYSKGLDSKSLIQKITINYD
ncbi:1-aminocyclopropane-1-carboxylate oxidase homolog 4-like [Durio zibethinus]|uniref:1-aminocyclopropane-1-carboxylate oxidase homolog 4-like n=1 Tax=Durio zibethinus TaxID=66656 RepID=A0A6P5Z411_DURZI|nr:1-aminocyclopropane-1-carboxylate oxidase homolog 4-like [Durio zibethinus]